MKKGLLGEIGRGSERAGGEAGAVEQEIEMGVLLVCLFVIILRGYGRLLGRFQLYAGFVDGRDAVFCAMFGCVRFCLHCFTK